MKSNIEEGKSMSKHAESTVLGDAWRFLVKHVLYQGGDDLGKPSKIDPQILRSVISKSVTDKGNANQE